VRLRHRVDRLEREAHTDALTGLFNYRHFTLTLQQEMERVRRSGLPLALVLCDIDHFKHFNDTHGHEVGNQMLVNVARIIDRQLRNLDTACRFGGEEFALILPGTTQSQAVQVAERVRAAVAQSAITLAHGERVNATLSLGVAGFVSADSLSPNELVAKADEQLYAAKHQGRNCVVAPRPKAAADTDQLVSAAEKAALFAPPESE
jgi:diguanylate cyclase (GGDEF)-like protein